MREQFRYSAASIGVAVGTLVRNNNSLINVREFGAQGDGVTDDTSAIGLAITALRAALRVASPTEGIGPTLFFPYGVYIITGTLNLTGIRKQTWGIASDGAVIIGKCAGKPMLDLMGSRYYRIVNLAIAGDTVLTPTYGIQCGRRSQFDSTGEFNYDRLQILGNFSRSCMYSLAPETVVFHHCRFWNSYNSTTSFCVIHDAGNLEGITSAFTTVTAPSGTGLSYNDTVYFNCDFRKSNSGTAILYQSGAVSGGLSGHRFIASYGAAFSDEVVKFVNVRATNMMHFDLHCETSGLQRCITIDNTTPGGTIRFRDFRFTDYAPQPAASIIDLTGGTRQVIIDNAYIWVGSPTTAVPVFGANCASKLTVGGFAGWSRSSGSFDVSNATFTGFTSINGEVGGKFPTSAPGLGSGALWNNNGVLTVVA